MIIVSGCTYTPMSSCFDLRWLGIQNCEKAGSARRIKGLKVLGHPRVP